MTRTPARIYLAGPDVFAEDAPERFARLEALCAARGLQGVRPSDGGVAALRDAGASPRELAERICAANLAHVRACDAVLAHLAPFRGDTEPDSGTVFELGFAVALGKPVAAYLPQAGEDLAARLRRLYGVRSSATTAGASVDLRHGMLVEDFGLPLNLMIACSATVHEDAAQALDALARRLAPGEELQGGTVR